MAEDIDTSAAQEPTPGQVLYPRDQIATRVAELGAALSERHAGNVPVLVTVLKGATMFAADLTRAMTIQHEMDFIAISAYGEQEAGRQAQVLKDLQIPLRGRHVVLVEDVVDTGLTLSFLLRWLGTHDPATVEVCTLLDRPQRRLVEADLAWRGFTVPDRFLVGYGFDYRQRYRNLPDLHVLDLGDGSFDDAVREQLLGSAPQLTSR